jgi:hypothetical protein
MLMSSSTGVLAEEYSLQFLLLLSIACCYQRCNTEHFIYNTISTTPPYTPYSMMRKSLARFNLAKLTQWHMFAIRLRYV